MISLSVIKEQILLDGGTGNDVFLITSFGGTLGAAGKADDGNPEWVAGDVIIGSQELTPYASQAAQQHQPLSALRI
jgi:hypothetical protein